MLVEDSELLRQVAEEMLRELGHDVIAAATAEEALLLIESNALSLMMTDVSLPGLSGIELARKTLALYPELPIVVASGHSDFSQDLLEKHLPKNVWWLSKPYDLDALESVLTKAAVAERR